MGVAGKVELLNEKLIAAQPIDSDIIISAR